MIGGSVGRDGKREKMEGGMRSGVCENDMGDVGIIDLQNHKEIVSNL